MGGERPGALVPDRILWEAAQLDYDEYVEAAAELVGRGLVENSLRGFLSLRAIPKGMKKE